MKDVNISVFDEIQYLIIVQVGSSEYSAKTSVWSTVNVIRGQSVFWHSIIYIDVQWRLPRFGHIERMLLDQIPHNTMHYIHLFETKETKADQNYRVRYYIDGDITLCGLILRVAVAVTNDQGQRRSVSCTIASKWLTLGSDDDEDGEYNHSKSLEEQIRKLMHTVCNCLCWKDMQDRKTYEQCTHLFEEGSGIGLTFPCPMSEVPIVGRF